MCHVRRCLERSRASARGLATDQDGLGRRRSWPLALVAAAALAACRPSISTNSFPPAPMSEPVTAIVGATVIDGTGAPPRPDATILLQGRHIRAVGSRQAVRVPANADVIDGRGLFVLPGFIDAGAVLGPPDRRLPWDTMYVPQSNSYRRQTVGAPDVEGVADTLIARRVANALRYGVTTVRAHGDLRAMEAVRGSIRAGRLRGSRLVMTGYVVGGIDAGAEFVPDSARIRVNQYLDHGVDFLKYAGTAMAYQYWRDEKDGRSYFLGAGDGTPAGEYAARPSYMVFSKEMQRTIVAAAHRRGVSVEAHANSPEALRFILEAGVDLVQHPEMMLNEYRFSDELIRLFVKRGVVCGLLPLVSAADRGRSGWENARQLIQAGCPVAVTSGATPGQATLKAIEALVTLGMTPMAALIAATRTGAKAAQLLDQVGVIAPGKLADLVVLRADPLQDITHIEQAVMVFAEGVRVPNSATTDDTNEKRNP